MAVGFLIFLWTISLIAPMSISNSKSSPLSRKFLDFDSPSFSSALRKVQRVSYYGERCATHFDCALQYGLTCLNSTCLCSLPQYIARLGPIGLETEKVTECVLRAGSECGLIPSLKEMQNIGIQRSFPTYIWTKLVKNIPFLTEDDHQLIRASGGKCVDNAICSQGVCHCLPEYFKDHRGLCLRKHTLYQPCEGDDNCKASEGLQCIGGRCQCKMSMVYDDHLRKCLIPVDGPCDAYSSSADTSDCVENAECSNGRCICLPGFTVSSDGSCGVSYGNPCGPGKKCSDIQFTCRSGKCQCRYPVHQKYNETLDLCLSKPDGPCSVNSTQRHHSCVSYANCLKTKSEEDSMFEYVCKCSDGYDEDQVGECVPSYMSSCNTDADCDQVGQLACINSKCSCPDQMLVWDQPRRKCVGVHGSRCKLIQLERLLSMKMDVPTECIEHAECVENVAVLDGRCECKKGYYFYKDSMTCVAHV